MSAGDRHTEPEPTDTGRSGWAALAVNGFIKICGLRTAAETEAAIEAGADAVGFVMFPQSPRHTPLKTASELSAIAKGRAEAVVLMVDPPAEALLLTRRFPIETVQFHGEESPDELRRCKDAFGVKVWKALGVAAAGDLARAAAFREAADRLVIDAKPPKDADRPGGHGAAFDWSILSGFAPGLPWLLAGGLGPDNVAAAIAATGAPGVDVSSGVESAPGVKDPVMIRDFCQAARAAFAARTA